MAAPTYNHDLTDVDLAETTTGWSHFGGGNIQLGAGPDFAMQGVNAVDGKISATEKGPYFDNGAGITFGAGDHAFVWAFNATPGLSDSLANRGLTVVVGSASTAYVQYHVEGNNTYGAAGRVGKCYPIDYTVRTSNTGSAPYRTLTGSPGANPRVFGVVANITATVKGSNIACDAIRYGTGAYLTDGELILNGDASDDPCTFADFSIENDYNDATNGYNRWGILTGVGGGYELQGAFVIGQNNAGTAAKCNFRDSDRAIALVDTPHAASTFTKFIIDHASTRCEWTNINITALGTTNRGSITVNNDSTAFIVNGGTFTGIGTTQIRASCVLDGVTWRGCDTVTRTGGDITNSTFDKSTASIALSMNTPNAIQFIENCHFISDGTGHAVDLGNVTSTQTVTWKNTLSGYVAGSPGSPITPGTSGNEAILCNVSAGQVLTISVAAGATVPSVKNDGTGTVNVVANQITLSVTVLDDATGLPIGTTCRVLLLKDSDKSELINSACNASGVASTTIDYDADTDVVGWAREWNLLGTDYEQKDFSGQYTASGFSVTVRLKPIS